MQLRTKSKYFLHKSLKVHKPKFFQRTFWCITQPYCKNKKHIFFSGEHYPIKFSIAIESRLKPTSPKRRNRSNPIQKFHKYNGMWGRHTSKLFQTQIKLFLWKESKHSIKVSLKMKHKKWFDNQFVQIILDPSEITGV
jgi:hypothetical protein